LIALTAARAVRLGENLNQIISKVKQIIPETEITVVLDTLKYLEKGGRAPKIGAWATTLLKIKPVATNRMGHAHLLGMARSRTQGIERMIKTMKENIGLNRISAIIIHSELETEAKELERRIHSEFNCTETYVTEISAVVAVHLGPGAIGIAFLPS
jgi:DegV family protein with EDD domain